MKLLTNLTVLSAAINGCDCGGADILRIIKFIFILLDALLFIIPMGLIVIVIVDLAKSVIAGKEDEMKKAQGTLIKRVIYAIAIFLVITIVTFVTGLIGSKDWRECWNRANGGETAETNKKDPEGDFCSENPDDPECY